jgi:hypothetical protein
MAAIGAVWGSGTWVDGTWAEDSWADEPAPSGDGMTYKEIQDQIMARLNLTSTEARTRIKGLINDRYRAVTSSTGLGRSRRDTVSVPVTAGNAIAMMTGVAKLFTLFDTVNLKAPLKEVSLDALREMDSPEITEGVSYLYAIKRQQGSTIVLQLFPKPSSSYSLSADVLAAFVPLVADSDKPAFPDDFHDLLVDAVMADELLKLEKATPLAAISRQRFEQRLSELRYFIVKSAWLHTVPRDLGGFVGDAGRVWPYSNLA